LSMSNSLFGSKSKPIERSLMVLWNTLSLIDPP
jgi:hypothetical protein